MRGISLAALALLSTSIATSSEPRTFLGFRLLDLEDQSVKWQSPAFGKPASVTYAFATTAVTTPDARNCAKLLPPEQAYRRSKISDADFRREAAAAFRMWERAANISFREADSPESADIVIGAQGEPVGRAFTNVALKAATDVAGKRGTSAGNKVIARSLICLNPRQPWKIGFDGNLDVYDLRYTLAHEIGHAIGLDHPSAAGELMSYRYDEKQKGLQPGDMRGAALLYGPRTPSRMAGRLPAAEDKAANADDADRGWPFGIGEAAAKKKPASR